MDLVCLNKYPDNGFCQGAHGLRAYHRCGQVPESCPIDALPFTGVVMRGRCLDCGQVLPHESAFVTLATVDELLGDLNVKQPVGAES